jgi:hypothetical protein
MSEVIQPHESWVKNGILKHSDLKFVWKNTKLYPPSHHRLLIQLMEKFEIMIPISHLSEESDIYVGESVIPALLPNELDARIRDTWNRGKPIALCRVYQFAFLPTQVFPRIISALIPLFGPENCKYWRDGIILTTSCPSLIETEGNRITLSFCEDFMWTFRSVFNALQTVLKQWNGNALDYKIFIICQDCINNNRPNKFSEPCFHYHDCILALNLHANSQFPCPYSTKGALSIKVLIPESQINPIAPEEIEKDPNQIGKGSYGVVYKAIYKGKPVALKELIIDELTDNEQTFREFIQEIYWMYYSQHPNIIQLVGVIFFPPAVILPFCEYGSLHHLLHNNEYCLTWILRLRILLDVANGMNYLHSLTPPVIHCDLRSPNVLIVSLNYRDNVALVADFGLAQFSVGRFLTGRKLNPAWSAPEVLNGMDLSPKADVYSFGTIIFEVLTGEHPYDQSYNPEWQFRHNVEDSAKKGIKPPYDKKSIDNYVGLVVPEDMITLLEACWNMKPWLRPTFSEITHTLSALYDLNIIK